MLTYTHTTVHLLIFLGYVAACVLVPQTLRQLLPLRAVTVVSGAAFFITCGTTHLFLAVDKSNVGPVVTVTDHLQAAAILVFVACLLADMRRAIRQGAIGDAG